MNNDKKALFIDRDGVVNLDIGYVHTKEKFILIEENVKLIKTEMPKYDDQVIVITNQAGIARGYYSEEEYLEFQDWVELLLKENDISIVKTYYCPHHPTEAKINKYGIDCDCRKPKPGMLVRASEDFNLNLSKCLFIGNSESDMLAGKAVGCPVMKV